MCIIYAFLINYILLGQFSNRVEELRFSVNRRIQKSNVQSINPAINSAKIHQTRTTTYSQQQQKYQTFPPTSTPYTFVQTKKNTRIFVESHEQPVHGYLSHARLYVYRGRLACAFR